MCAARLVEDDDQTYEVAISVAQAADRYTEGSSPESVAAATIRDVFATWVERMHAGADSVYGESHDSAFAAHDQISAAISDWRSGGREDLSAFARRWAARVSPIDTTWLQEPATPLVRASRSCRLINRLRTSR
jgi:hypothetical protein